MPSFQLHTNVSKDSIPENFLTELSSTIAGLLGKPEMYVCIHVIPDQLMTFAGTSDPCAIGNLTSIGKIGLEENKEYTKILMAKLTETLKIPADRMYINYWSLERSNVGWNNKTFAS